MAPNFMFGLGEYEEGFRKIEEACVAFWKHPQHLPFTIHGPKHSENIVTKVDQWFAFAPSTLQLSPQESFILQGAAYLHDIGMQCRDPELLMGVAGVTYDETKQLLQLTVLNKVREFHGALSCEMILDASRDARQRKYPELRLDGSQYPQEYEAIALISQGHVGDIPPQVIKEYQGVSGGPINLLLLQHLLRVGDALDAEASRINREYYSSTNWDAFFPVDKFHILKHQYVTNLAISGGGVFTYHYAFPPDVPVEYVADIRTCAEAPLRKHLEKHGATLRNLRMPFSEVCTEEPTCASAVWRAFDDDAKKEFRAQAERLRGGAPSVAEGGANPPHNGVPEGAPSVPPTPGRDTVEDWQKERIRTLTKWNIAGPKFDLCKNPRCETPPKCRVLNEALAMSADLVRTHCSNKELLELSNCLLGMWRTVKLGYEDRQSLDLAALYTDFDYLYALLGDIGERDPLVTKKPPIELEKLGLIIEYRIHGTDLRKPDFAVITDAMRRISRCLGLLDASDEFHRPLSPTDLSQIDAQGIMGQIRYLNRLNNYARALANIAESRSENCAETLTGRLTDNPLEDAIYKSVRQLSINSGGPPLGVWRDPPPQSSSRRA